MFPHFGAAQLQLCVHLTRILLPAQLFFYVGGVVSAVLLSRRLFLFPALGPLLYNVSIILGGIVLAGRLGISSLAYGALTGSFLGPFLVNAIGARRVGTGYSPSLNLRNPAFLEWVKLSIPLMLGVSLVTADDWILRFFASGGAGDITRLNYAKRLLAVPIAVLGQATGQASLPFFARLFGEKRMQEFEQTVSNSVYRISAVSFLVTALMMSTALPVVDLVYRRGRFQFSDSRETAIYFFWFALSLAFWSAQALYSRAFYAASNTLTPMIAGTIITLASLPIYSLLFRSLSVMGLAIASDVGIVANAVVLAWLLHQRRLVRVSTLPLLELGKAFAISVIAWVSSFGVARAIPLDGTSRVRELCSIGLAFLTWAAATAAGLWLTRSELPAMLRARARRTTYPHVAEKHAEELSAGIEP